MSKFNKFESHTNEILDEAVGDVLNKAQAALKHMTPGSGLFDGPGNITNKYDVKKNYYPNIRSGFMGLVNASQNKASQGLIDRINQLKQINTWNSEVQLPSELNGIVSTQYSQQFIPTAEAEIEQARRALEEAYKRMPRDPQSEKLYNQLINTDTSGMSKSQKSSHSIKMSGARDDIDALMQLQEYMNKQQYSTLSMLQKAHIQTYIAQFNEAFNKWMGILKAKGSLSNIQGSNNQQVDTAEMMVPGTTFLRTDVTVYRDQWENFLNIVQNGIVGSGQRGYTTGANVNSILVGAAPGTYHKKGEVKYTEQGTMSPDVMKKFHEKIMMPLFMSGKNSVLIYATPEQWGSISKGGRLYKGVTGAGKEAFQAGQKIPKVRL